MKTLNFRHSIHPFFAISILVLLASLLFTSCNDDDDDDMVMQPTPENIVGVLDQITESPESYMTDDTKSARLKATKPKFKHLRQALVKTKLVSTVASTELTVFAPTDEAFNMLFEQLGIDGIDDLTAEQLTPILLYHVVGGKVSSGKLSNGYVETVNGSAIRVDLTDGVMINDAQVTIADLHAANGIIHIIDKVLLPPSMNLVETALSYDPEFSILVQAVVKADLQETLETGGPFTVFAPTNDAFVALLGELGLPDLDAIPTETLVEVLKYHVVAGRVYSSDLVSGEVSSLNGTFSVNTSTLTITDAQTREANLIPSLLNVQATNGVIHVIDKVLLP
ncbi:fasciclin domain-containing protein [Mangrovibacterium marinum]|uniref:Putative surface protein with fasciclin (FAS1) repeats n=1 Tax=Mangrovibacterium marinum TaxID=1639118 RepID=A0A2T5C5W0_9BACT|nr:fasciclin domain-containing protein [Mangrovibacterium marinum]PTN10262.1 putative surface protein with fasciclin (FAS1) repeats [Mangrovibacterium marinum]